MANKRKFRSVFEQLLDPKEQYRWHYKLLLEGISRECIISVLGIGDKVTKRVGITFQLHYHPGPELYTFYENLNLPKLALKRGAPITYNFTVSSEYNPDSMYVRDVDPRSSNLWLVQRSGFFYYKQALEARWRTGLTDFEAAQFDLGKDPLEHNGQSYNRNWTKQARFSELDRPKQIIEAGVSRFHPSTKFLGNRLTMYFYFDDLKANLEVITNFLNKISLEWK